MGEFVISEAKLLNVTVTVPITPGQGTTVTSFTASSIAISDRIYNEFVTKEG